MTELGTGIALAKALPDMADYFNVRARIGFNQRLQRGRRRWTGKTPRETARQCAEVS